MHYLFDASLSFTCLRICEPLCMVFSKIPVFFFALTVRPEQIHFAASDLEIVASNEQPTAELVLMFNSSFVYCCCVIVCCIW